ncbi:maleylpyruvate isomerase family mycothiol-dependent enzyme [Arsenicicoccus sp. MKL-02]|uniref:Maleylpyruvate isomerase family mycothiol-dependent enzyme n=1 Tax=Arsenicicoccus cauae TaxID=2663847 RepID=A0A6I3IJ60_9MICO|nr:maleylpyruvate isomerase family mycothiol-dependent enzyme [Arsenicicoccus cauae]MTB72693.1 maleylpyruvate isomerase family mycothiol-dependent enzyme [Arsenicicoccus cauae]
MDAIWNSVHRERAALIRDLRDLGPHDWDAESGCRRWRIRDVVAHLVDTAATTPTTFLTGMVRAGFDFDRQNELGVERYRDKQPDELISLLVQVRDRTSGPPRFMAPLATRLVEEIVHGEDIRRPLGLHREYQPEDLQMAIEYQVATSVRIGGAREKLVGVMLVADDIDWTHGQGSVVTGPALEILMLVCGRPPRSGVVAGPGLVRF